MSEHITIRRATIEDLASVESILQEAGVDTTELEKWIDSFLMAEMIKPGQAIEGTKGEKLLPELVATAGLEKYGKMGLLRSLVIRKKAWSAEESLQLLHLMLTYAGNIGLDEVYLLTQSPTVFIHMGFAEVLEGTIPAQLLYSVHFRQNLQKAILMRKILN